MNVKSQKLLDQIKSEYAAIAQSRKRGDAYPQVLRAAVNEAVCLGISIKDVWQYCGGNDQTFYNWLQYYRKICIDKTKSPVKKLEIIEDATMGDLDEHVWVHLNDGIYVKMALRLLTSDFIHRVTPR